MTQPVTTRADLHPQKNSVHARLAMAIAMMIGAGAVAQTLPATGLDLIRAPVIVVPQGTELQIDDSATRRRLVPPTTGKGPKFAVAGFRIVGLTVPVKADLSAVLAKYLGPNRSFDDLEAAAEAVQTAIRQEGLFLAQVDIPPQKLEGGMVELRVIEGRLEKWELAPLPEGLLVGRDQIEAILSRLQPGSLLKVNDIERVLFLLSDLRGISVKSVIEPGAKPGTAKLVVTAEPGQRFEKNIDVDNYGSLFTGVNRLSGAVEVNSPFGRGDLFKLSGNASADGGLNFVRAAYQSPVGGSGLKLGAAISALSYKLGTDAFVPLQATGDASVFSIFALYPVVRTRNFNTFAQVNYDRREFQDNQKTLAIENKKHSDVMSLGFVGDSRDQFLGGGINNLSASLTFGNISLDSPTLLLADQAATGRNVNGAFGKINYGASRQNLIWSDAKNSQDRLVLYASWQGQRASRNLDNSEKFSLGGSSGVRGYAGGEGTGDSGDLLSWELRKNIVSDKVKGDLVLSVFGDYGQVTVNRVPLATDLVNQITLVSHGLGLAWAVQNNFLLKLSVAWRGDYLPVSDPDPKSSRIYLTLSKTL